MHLIEFETAESEVANLQSKLKTVLAESLRISLTTTDWVGVR